MNWGVINNLTWKDYRGKVKSKWGKLTEDDLTAIDGNHDRFIDKLSEVYLITKEDATKQGDDWYAAVVEKKAPVAKAEKAPVMAKAAPKWGNTKVANT